MSATIEFQRGDRVLVLAPHPDDETLATGGLLQRALAAQCAVRVIVATDGENNPWPQRWLERRWFIDGPARARWGARRRRESIAAFSILGVDADAVRYLGWPDLGLTDCMLAGPDAERRLLAEIEDFAPTVIAAPVVFDRHPDHSALRILLDIALKRASDSRTRILGFVVHGDAMAQDSSELTLDASQQQVKRRALIAHASQMALSHRRLLRIASRIERYEWNVPNRDAFLPSGSLRLRISPPTRSLLSRQRDLLLVFGVAGLAGAVVLRTRIVLPRSDGHVQASIDTDAGAVQLVIRVDSTAIDVSLRSPLRLEWGFIKIERSGRRLIIFDCDGWHPFADCLVDAGVSAEAALSIGRR